jgi:hypothetical protein
MAPSRTSGLPPIGVAHRFASSAASPSTYDKATHSCDCIISTGAAVQRMYGTEKLRIDSKSVDLSRVEAGSAPLLDSHSQASIDAVLGRIDSAWIANGRLFGHIVFARTEAGRQAEGMVARNELRGISAGYSVSKWEISDANGNVLDPNSSPRWDDDLTFTAVRFQILEASLVGVPADAASAVRSFGGAATGDLVDIRARANARQLIHVRQSMYDAQARVIGKHHE